MSSDLYTLFRDEKINFTLRKIPIEADTRAEYVTDRGDKKFSDLINHVYVWEHFRDYKILFASRDSQTFSDIQGNYTRIDRHQRVHFAENLKDFEKLIAC